MSNDQRYSVSLILNRLDQLTSGEIAEVVDACIKRAHELNGQPLPAADAVTLLQHAPEGSLDSKSPDVPTDWPICAGCKNPDHPFRPCPPPFEPHAQPPIPLLPTEY